MRRIFRQWLGFDLNGSDGSEFWSRGRQMSMVAGAMTKTVIITFSQLLITHIRASFVDRYAPVRV